MLLDYRDHYYFQFLDIIVVQIFITKIHSHLQQVQMKM